MIVPALRKMSAALTNTALHGSKSVGGLSVDSSATAEVAFPSSDCSHRFVDV